MKVVIAMKIVIHKVTGRSDSSEDEESEMCSTFMGLQPYQYEPEKKKRWQEMKPTQTIKI